jgi:hypothetical protein
MTGKGYELEKYRKVLLQNVANDQYSVHVSASVGVCQVTHHFGCILIQVLVFAK